MSNVEPNLWSDHASTETRVRGRQRISSRDVRGRSHGRHQSQSHSMDNDRVPSRAGKSRQGLASKLTTLLRLMAGATVSVRRPGKKRRPKRRQSSGSVGSSGSHDESRSSSPDSGQRGDDNGAERGMPGHPHAPPGFIKISPGHPFVSQGGPRPPGPPFFTQPPFNPGSAPPRPPSSPRSESERSSCSQSSRDSSHHSTHDSPPDILTEPPIPQRTAFYGEPKYSEYQLPGTMGDRPPSPRPSFLSALPDDVQVSSWTDVTRVSWTKGRVGEVEDEHVEAGPPAASPPFPPGAGGGPFNPFSAPAPPNSFQPQPGNIPPPGMQPFPNPFGHPPGEAFVPGTQP